MGSGKSHDDLTYQLSDIIKANAAIRENIAGGAAPHVIAEAVDYLQFKVATLADNQLPHMPQSLQVSLGPPGSSSS
jgi:DNA-directed RNA polymerase II subunit RPB1